MMNPKPKPNHPLYIQTLRRMTGEQRLAKAFELTEMARQIFRDGLRARHPGIAESDLDRLVAEGWLKCHNRWSKMSGGSEKQLADARHIIEVQGETMDQDYLREWARELNVEEALSGILTGDQ